MQLHAAAIPSVSTSLPPFPVVERGAAPSKAVPGSPTVRRPTAVGPISVRLTIPFGQAIVTTYHRLFFFKLACQARNQQRFDTMKLLSALLLSMIVHETSARLSRRARSQGKQREASAADVERILMEEDTRAYVSVWKRVAS